VDDHPGGPVGGPCAVEVLLQDRRGRGTDRAGPRETGDVLLVEHRRQRDVQADEHRGQRRAEHRLRRLGIGPHVELRRGGHVAARGCRSTHHDEPADPRGGLREHAQQQRHVGQRADGGDGDGLGRGHQ
jgi:hypothetical protein